MGCSHSDLLSVTRGVFSHNGFEKAKYYENTQLTAEQIEKIQQTWRLIDDQKQFGLNIMIRLVY